MERLNSLCLQASVRLIDWLYEGRDYQRFWVLEEVARAPYFAFLSVLHLKESMGLRGDKHLYLMREHFEQSVNETEHLEYMESRGGGAYWVDRAFAKHLVLIYYWINVVYYWISPRFAYHLSHEIEIHAAITYAKYLAIHGEDEKILEILNDEVRHVYELGEAMKSINGKVRG